MRFAVLLLISAGMSFAATYSGALVDAKCWGFEQRNVNPQDTGTFVDRDRNLEIRMCTPNKKTSRFAIVPPDGVSLNLDAAGNAKASDLVRTPAGKKSLIAVSVTGELDRRTIAVQSISAR